MFVCMSHEKKKLRHKIGSLGAKLRLGTEVRVDCGSRRIFGVVTPGKVIHLVRGVRVEVVDRFRNSRLVVKRVTTSDHDKATLAIREDKINDLELVKSNQHCESVRWRSHVTKIRLHITCLLTQISLFLLLIFSKRIVKVFNDIIR